MSAQHSPSIAAALAKNPHLAAVDRANSDEPVPHPSSPLARELFGMGATAELSKPPVLESPPPPGSRREMFEAQIRERGPNSEFALAAITAAQSLDNLDQPDAVTAALVRIDALDERAARYRIATGDARRLAQPGVPLSCKIEPSLIAELETLARQRGETRSETMRYLMRCGMILADERRKRYEAYMMAQMIEKTAAAGAAADTPEAAREAQQEELARIEPERYVDPQSPSLERALQYVDPFGGAPDEVRKVVAELPPPAPKPQKPAWY